MNVKNILTFSTKTNATFHNIAIRIAENINHKCLIHYTCTLCTSLQYFLKKFTTQKLTVIFNTITVAVFNIDTDIHLITFSEHSHRHTKAWNLHYLFGTFGKLPVKVIWEKLKKVSITYINIQYSLIYKN